MKTIVTAAIVLLLLSGCTGRDAGDNPTDPGPTEPIKPPPKQVLSKEGNAECAGVVKDPVTFDFVIEEQYHVLELAFHASGLGNVGLELRDSNGTVIHEIPDYNPGNQPCTHAHEGAADLLMNGPGAYEVTVRNTGIVAWHLIVNELAGDANATHAGH